MKILINLFICILLVACNSDDGVTPQTIADLSPVEYEVLIDENLGAYNGTTVKTYEDAMSICNDDVIVDFDLSYRADPGLYLLENTEGTGYGETIPYSSGGRFVHPDTLAFQNIPEDPYYVSVVIEFDALDDAVCQNYYGADAEATQAIIWFKINAKADEDGVYFEGTWEDISRCADMVNQPVGAKDPIINCSGTITLRR